MNDPLFQLIKAMNTAEKIHFKRTIKKQADGKEPSYLILFDCLDQMEEFENGALQKKLKTKKFDVNFTKTKAYLYELLIDFIEEYNSDKSIFKATAKLFRKSQILYQKGLYTEAFSMLEKVKEQAAFYELNEIMLQVHSQEMALLWGNNNTKKISLMNEKHTLKRLCINNLNTLNEHENIFNLLHLHYMENPSARDADILKNVNELFNKLKQLPHTSLFYPNLLKHLSLALYYNLKQEYRQMHENYRKVIELYSLNEHMKARYNAYYSNALKNHLAGAHYYREYDNYQSQMDMLSAAINKLQGHYKTFPFLFLQFLKLDILLTRGDIEKAIALIESSKQGKPLFTENIFELSILFSLYQKYASVYFINKEYKKANHYINLLLNEFSIQAKGRTDLFFAAKILKLMISYEMGDVILLNDLLLSTQRYFIRHNKLHELEKLLFQHFKDLIKENDNSLWQRNKNILEKFDPYFLFEFIGFDILSWFESKICKKDFVEILIRKARENYPLIFEIKIS
jgi:hypothetical protein